MSGVINQEDIRPSVLPGKIFYIQDSDRPMHVIADDWQGAIKAWKSVIAVENEIHEYDVAEPQGIQLIAENDDPRFPDWISA